MEETKTPPEPTPQSDRRRIQSELYRKWKWSPWRIVPLPISAYLVTGTYLWSVGTTDAWKKALGPVLTVGTFVIVAPMVRNWWFRNERKRMFEALQKERGVDGRPPTNA